MELRKGKEKIIEENEMWRQWKTEQQGPEENNPSFLKGQCSDMRYEFPKRRNKRAYMDEEPQSTFWMKELFFLGPPKHQSGLSLSKIGLQISGGDTMGIRSFTRSSLDLPGVSLTPPQHCVPHITLKVVSSGNQTGCLFCPEKELPSNLLEFGQDVSYLLELGQDDCSVLRRNHSRIFWNSDRINQKNKSENCGSNPCESVLPSPFSAAGSLTPPAMCAGNDGFPDPPSVSWVAFNCLAMGELYVLKK
ncbi:hypothetical protein MAR_020977 [Mya arenaria]|uniref:Uncharacterized protein n=1 Tax=Mya arenaria TaxID=6604 RepID=A0ABY7E6K1_MYAAR|nr:hypothetical protein MAR_020977 [Mya arenaria]